MVRKYLTAQKTPFKTLLDDVYFATELINDMFPLPRFLSLWATRLALGSWLLRMRVSISPIGSFIDIVRSPYQLDLTMPGI